MSEGTNEKEVEARRWEDSELDTTEGVVTFEHGTVNLPMWAEGRWKDVPLSTVLAAYASSREAANEKLIEELVEALENFGDHKASCATNAASEDFGHLGCTCGLAAAIARARGGQKK